MLSRAKKSPSSAQSFGGVASSARPRQSFAACPDGTRSSRSPRRTCHRRRRQLLVELVSHTPPPTPPWPVSPVAVDDGTDLPAGHLGAHQKQLEAGALLSSSVKDCRRRPKPAGDRLSKADVLRHNQAASDAAGGRLLRWRHAVVVVVGRFDAEASGPQRATQHTPGILHAPRNAARSSRSARLVDRGTLHVHRRATQISASSIEDRYAGACPHPAAAVPSSPTIAQVRLDSQPPAPPPSRPAALPREPPPFALAPWRPARSIRGSHPAVVPPRAAPRSSRWSTTCSRA